MNILFLFQRFSFESSTIYLDLVEECVRRGHNVYVLAGNSEHDEKNIVDTHGCKVCYVKLPDQFHAGKIKKGLVQLLIEPMFVNVLKKNLWDVNIDLIAYPTPPITLAGVVKAAKNHYGARTYLMLKDIFPQNAVDLHMMRENSLLHRYFKSVEKSLYAVSDHIGCMSPANIEYMKEHNPQFAQRLELFPNTVRLKPDKSGEKTGDNKEVVNLDVTLSNENAANSTAAALENETSVRFVLGGNLGKPQAIDLTLKAIEVLDHENYKDAYFYIVGDGTEREKVEGFFAEKQLRNAEYHRQLPRDEYEQLLEKQDVGIITLSPDFTIPNFPSRSLSYMQMSKPMLVATDRVCDIGRIIAEEAQCGYFVYSGDCAAYVNMIKKICDERASLKMLGENGRRYLEKNYSVEISVDILERVI